MQFKYHSLHYRNFRRVIQNNIAHWLVKKGLWLCYIPLHIITYIYQPELQQLR